MGLITPLKKEELRLFPDLDLRWDYPAQISNSIIDIGWCNITSTHKLLSQLNKLNCSDIQIRILDILEKKDIENI
jgi:hypothetical protein